MQFLIARPNGFIDYFKDSRLYLKDINEFYDNLIDTMCDMGINHKVLHINKMSRVIHKEPDSIYLAWHSHGTLPNIWHIKTAYIPDYFYFDKNGYGPWSEIVNACDYEIPVEVVRNDVEQFCEQYIKDNKSRIKHPKQSFGIPNKPYVLVLGQRPDDAVSDFAYTGLDTMSLVKKVSDAFKGTKYNVCTRGHPLDSAQPYGTLIDSQSTGNLHECIAGASAVYTVNSGSGFEALLHGKRVFTTGVCDYNWATTAIKNDNELKSSVELIDEPIDEDNRIKFIHYMLKYHFVHATDTDSIQRKIIRAVMEYESEV